MIRLGVIGCGKRALGLLDLVERLEQDAKVVAIADPRSEEVERETVGRNWLDSKARFFTEADQMLEEVELDGVLVATRCSLHTTMALKVLRRNLPLFLEKPVATTLEDWRRLREAGERSAAPVVVSFPLRVSPLVRLAKEVIDSGKLGRIQHAQAWCYPTYGGVYYHRWYRDESETGGLFLQKATHDFDYLNFLLDRRPVRIAAMTSKQVFTGDKPAGLTCTECPEKLSCPESDFNLFFLRGETDRVKPTGRLCAFATDTGNEDSSSALIEYEDGMHAVYTQCFYARKGAGSRGARLTGYKGTLQFDWNRAKLTVYLHHRPIVEHHECQAVGSHGGGDLNLVHNFLQVIRGEAESVAPLEAGLTSALMCLKARESARDRAFKEITD